MFGGGSVRVQTAQTCNFKLLKFLYGTMIESARTGRLENSNDVYMHKSSNLLGPRYCYCTCR